MAGMTDQEHTDQLALAESQLNQAIHDAAVSGLTVEVETREINRFGGAAPVPVLRLTISRRIIPTEG